MANLERRSQLLELETLRREERDAVRELALRSTYAMASLVLWPDMPQAGLHEPFHGPLADFIDSAKPGGRKMVIVPRGHRKTYLLTYAHAVRRICVDPNVRILIVTALDSTAKKMMGVLRKQFTDNQSFAYYFPEMVFDASLGTQYDFVHPLRTVIEQNPTARTTYTGAPLIGNRADIVICDDAVAEDKVASSEMADKNNSHLNELVPILDINPRYDMMFVVGTLKSHNDYYAVGSGQATSNDENNATPVFECIKRAALETDGRPDLNGDPILPTVFSREKLLQIKNQCAANPAQGEGYFYREYMGQVQAPQDQKFQAAWLETWVDPAMVPQNTIFSAITVDSAFKDAQITQARGDTTVCLIGHFDSYNNLYLTDGVRGRYQSDQFRKLLLSMLDNPKNRQAQNLVKEKVGEGTIFTEFKRWFMEARKPLVNFPVPVIGRGEKVLRIINSLQGPLMGRKIFFVKGQFPEDLHKVMVDELTHLGQWGHDDAADALALFFHPDVRPMTDTHRAAIKWKDVVSRPMQISTSWNNHTVAAHEAARLAPATTPNGRLTPFGQDISLDHGTFMVEGSGPKEMPPMEWTPVIQKIGG